MNGWDWPLHDPATDLANGPEGREETQARIALAAGSMGTREEEVEVEGREGEEGAQVVLRGTTRMGEGRGFHALSTALGSDVQCVQHSLTHSLLPSVWVLLLHTKDALNGKWLTRLVSITEQSAHRFVVVKGWGGVDPRAGAIQASCCCTLNYCTAIAGPSEMRLRCFGVFVSCQTITTSGNCIHVAAQ